MFVFSRTAFASAPIRLLMIDSAYVLLKTNQVEEQKLAFSTPRKGSLLPRGRSGNHTSPVCVQCFRGGATLRTGSRLNPEERPKRMLVAAGGIFVTPQEQQLLTSLTQKINQTQ